jgi:hypothetical protein
MPRYRGYGNYGRNAAAPQPIINKAPKLDVTGLTAAYEWLAVDRTLGLRMATEWYAANTNALLFGAPLDAARQRDYDRAQKAVNLGQGNDRGNANDSQGERENAYHAGLLGYEKVWAGKTLPKIADAWTATPSHRAATIKTVFDGINTSFAPIGVRYEPSNKLTERDYTAGVMTLPRGEMEDLCGQPPLQVLLAEAVTATRAKATVLMVRDGKTVFGEDKKPLYEVNGALFMANLPLVLEGVYAWAAQAGGSLTKPVGKVRSAKSPRTPKVPGTPQVPGTRDSRLPAPGTILTKRFHGVDYHVTVLVGGGFEYLGKTWKALTAISLAISGGKARNGFQFFGL